MYSLCGFIFFKSYMGLIWIKVFYFCMHFNGSYYFFVVLKYKQSKYDYNLAHMFLPYNSGVVRIVIVKLFSLIRYYIVLILIKSSFHSYEFSCLLFFLVICCYKQSKYAYYIWTPMLLPYNIGEINIVMVQWNVFKHK